MAGQRNTLTYREAGVDIDAGNNLVERIKPAAAATRRPGVVGGIGGFGALFDLKAAGFHDPLIVATTDGVGTKLKIAIECGEHRTIGIDLVAMCVNDLVAQGAEPLLFLDYYATGALDVEAGAQVIEGIAEGCRIAGASLSGGETAEMPGLYRAGDYDLAGFALGAVERDAVLPRSDLTDGDVLLGLASSGLHSNGFSLVRRVADESRLRWSDNAPFAARQTLGAALLEPTRIYVGACLDAMRTTGAVKAIAHITGGGLLENVPRMLPETLAAEVDLASIRVPPVFGWLAERVKEAEMLRTFNCGIGMVLAVEKSAVPQVRSALERHGETVFEIGRLRPRHDKPIDCLGRLDFGG